MARDTTMTVAVIGLGSMGQGVARSLLRAGLAVAGYDLDAAAMEKLTAAGGQSAASPAAAAAGADAVVTVVVNAEQTEAVLFGESGAVPAMKAGAIVLSLATMAPADARRLAQRAEESGALYLDAPISGGAAKAADGKLTVLASGKREAFEKAGPILNAIAATVHELGDEAGIGASFKIVNQLLAGVHIAAACEAIVFARRLGLDLDKVYEVITGSAGNSWMFADRVPHILQGDYAPRSAVDIFVKDLGIVGTMGQQQKFPLPVAATALQMFLAASAAGMGRDDDASVARSIARATGLSLPGMDEKQT
jgi:L-threonate 2-dehydrogenase